MTLLAPLAFFVAALVGIVAIAGSVLRYRDSVLATLAANRDIQATRDFDFRVFEFGRQTATVGKIPRSGQRVVGRRAATFAGWREAA